MLRNRVSVEWIGDCLVHSNEDEGDHRICGGDIWAQSSVGEISIYTTAPGKPICKQCVFDR